jgi:hypothetical protein
VPPLPVKDVDDLRQHVEWLLEGYGGVDRGLMRDGMSPLPFASWEAAMNHFNHVREAQGEELREIERLRAAGPEGLGPSSRTETTTAGR